MNVILYPEYAVSPLVTKTINASKSENLKNLLHNKAVKFSGGNFLMVDNGKFLK